MANEQNLTPFTSDQSREEAARNGQKGGIASGKARRERKTLAEVLRAELEKDAGSGLTKQEYLVAKCLADLADKKGKVFPKDLKTLAEVLGELHINVDHSGDALIKVVRDEEEAEKLANIGELNG